MNLFKTFRSLFSNKKDTIAVVSDVTKIKSDIQNLMVVLRESGRENGKDATLVPMFSAQATLADGNKVDLKVAWFSFIGDMHLRFVYDGPQSMRNLTSEEFLGLNLSPDQALRLAVSNIKRVYGHPKIRPLEGNLMLVKCESPDLDSSYFLDETFWQNLLIKHPEGLVVGVPERGGLMFVPASDREAVAGLRQGIGALFESSEKMRVSSALYLFKDNCWSVFQDPISKP